LVADIVPAAVAAVVDVDALAAAVAPARAAGLAFRD
jgi:hypothetical protein